MPIIINIDEISRLRNHLRNINKLNINEIVFVDDQGNKHEYTEEELREWKYTGLNICDFIEYFLIKK